MLSAERIRALLAGMPPNTALAILAALEAGMPLEASRLATAVLGDGVAGSELIASIIRERSR